MFTSRNTSLDYSKLILLLLVLVFLYLDAFIDIAYLKIEPPFLGRIVLFGILLLTVNYRLNNRKILRAEMITFLIFSACFSMSIILGFHIIMENGYSGTCDNTYISNYSISDLFAFGCLLIASYLISTTVYLFVSKNRKFTAKRLLNTESTPPPLKHTVLFATIIFIAWLPYLLTYFPGFVFGDSVSSIRQALDLRPWSNHHPFAYTMLIKFCLFLSHCFGLNNTWGCALYSLIQMGFMAFCFAYMFNWISTRTSTGLLTGMTLSIIYGGTPYVAELSISMWKDPIFSSAIVLLSVLTAELAATSRLSQLQMVSIGFSACIVVLSRNNGLYIIAALLIVLIIITAIKRIPAFKCATLTILGALVLATIITGSIYASLGVQETERAETLGVPLNQMARVVALNGDYSEEEAEYLDSILPINMYKDAYRPSITDPLKRDKNFDNEPLKKDFFKYWLSMMIKNPRVYFEAWELQTFGFWTINQPESNNFPGNISSGMPINPMFVSANDGIYNEIDIYPENITK